MNYVVETLGLDWSWHPIRENIACHRDLDSAMSELQFQIWFLDLSPQEARIRELP